MVQNHSLLGVQIDIYLEMQVQGGITIKLAIDAKNYSGNVPAEEARKCVNDFNALKSRGLIDKGIVVSAQGFSKDANTVIIDSGHEALQMRDLRIKSLDFTKYLTKWLTDYEKEKKRIFKYISLTAKKDKGQQLGQLDNYLMQWIKSGTSHITLLGNYGTGKSTTLRKVMAMQAQKYLDNPESERIPIFIELKGFRQAPKSQSLITDILVNEFGLNINYFKFKEMNAKGRFLIILDGFDEMAERVVDGLPYHHFDELSRLAPKNGKVILSSRTHYFRDQEHVLEIHEQSRDLLSHIERKQGYEIVYINCFSKEDIDAYLKAVFNKNWVRHKEIIKNTYDLYALAEVPILLNMLVQVLPEMTVKSISFNRVEIYRTFTNKWFQRESWRRSVTKKERFMFCKMLAFHFYTSKINSVHWRELPEFIRKTFTIEKSDDLDIFDSDVRTSNFLKRAENSGQYSFVHKSFMEFFVAEYFYENIQNEKKNGLDDLKDFMGSKVIYEFLLEMLNMEDISMLQKDIWIKETINIRKIMTTRGDVTTKKVYNSPESLGNCVYLLMKSGISMDKANAESAYLSGVELNDISFCNANLKDANFENCTFNKVKFNNSTLSGASFRNSSLTDVDFTSSTVDKTDFRNTDLYKSTFSTIYLAKYWASAKLDDGLRVRLERAYKRNGEVNVIEND